MKNFFKILGLGLTFGLWIVIILGISYFALKARQATNPTTDSNAGNIYVNAGETLTATKRNTLADMTSEARTVSSTAQTQPTSTYTDIPWMTTTITLKRAALVQIYVQGVQYQVSWSYWQAGYNIKIDSTSYCQRYNRTTATYLKAWDTWSIVCSVSLSAGDYTISTQIWWAAGSPYPYVCGTDTVHIPCTMNIQAFY